MDKPSSKLATIIQDAKQGDQPARGYLLQEYRPFLRVIAEQAIGARLRRRVDASDIVQQTCLEAHQAMDNFQGVSEPEFTAWIKQILRRNVANLIRDNRAAKRDMVRDQPLYNPEDTATVMWQEPVGQQSSPSQRMIRGEAAIQLAMALEFLPKDQRTAVQLRHLEGLPLREIAEQMDRSPPAVAGLIQRGLKTLRTKLPSGTTNAKSS